MKIVFFLFLLLLINCWYSQESKDTISQTSRNNIYFEIAGQSGFFSLNYERLFTTRNKKILLAGRSSIYYFNMYVLGHKSSSIGSPFSISLLSGKTRHKIELGISTSIDFSWSSTNSSKSLLNCLILGYRLQPKYKDVIIRITYCPYLFYDLNDNESHRSHWGGFSFGYCF
ncbi:MAG: hypothetical protein H6599_01315 [Flavobacteriales bacterium]|nr:hypothetical protein [Flavobacteriales bacterium]